MIHKIPVIALTIITFLLSSCQNSMKEKSESVFLFPEITKTIDTGKLSEIISIADARILGNYEDFMIGRIDKIKQFEDSCYAIKSSGSPIVIYDASKEKFTKIGEIGAAEEEYVNPLDFDVYNDIVYVLTTSGIKRYGFDGKYINTIKTDVNADGMRVAGNNILLFVLGDKNVIHLIDMKGKTIAEELPRNSALRLSRAISFSEFGDFILFHQGHSNNTFAYNQKHKSFHDLKLISDEQALTIEDEASLNENGIKLPDQEKPFFDAFTTGGKQISVGVIKDGKPYIYVAKDDESTSISINDVNNDILHDHPLSFFTKGVDSNNKFITYIYPYILLEHKNEILESSTCPEVIKNIAATVKEDDNPILIEYEFK